MSRSANLTPRAVVEDCDIVDVSETARCLRLGLSFGLIPTRGGGQRACLLCPICGRRAFRLHRPVLLQAFACRSCHDLTYRSVQKHDARLDRLLKKSDCEIMYLVAQNSNMTWKFLAICAGYIRLGLMPKY